MEMYTTTIHFKNGNIFVGTLSEDEHEGLIYAFKENLIKSTGTYIEFNGIDSYGVFFHYEIAGISSTKNVRSEYQSDID